MESLFLLPLPILGALSPFGILALGILAVVGLIVVARVHPFFALLIAAAFVGLISPSLPQIDPEKLKSFWILALEWPMVGLGKTAGGIAFAIALAAVIGLCLMESGAADVIVRRLVALLGEKRAGLALLGSGFFLSIPVFFDTVFFLLVPLARALSLRTGKNYLYYVLAICAGGVITHSLVAPTPGPIAMADKLNIDLGITIAVGVVLGLGPALFGLYLSRLFDLKMPIAMREVPGASMDDLKAILEKEDHELPSFGLSIVPVVLPVFLIILASVLKLAGGVEAFGPVYSTVEFLGNKNFALLLGTVIALWILARQKGYRLSDFNEVIASPLQTAGVIILITSAGGAFGSMLVHAGIKDAVRALADDSGMSYILLAWLLAALLKIAQGSGTVSMITTATIMAGVLSGVELSYHPVYIFSAIGFGSLFISWMNDSGFWVVGKMSGLTETETLKTWTPLLAGISLVGLAETLVLSLVFPGA